MAREMLQPIPGEGILARYGDLALLCDGDPRYEPQISALLDLVAEVAGQGGDGRRVGRRLAALLVAAEDDGEEFPALCLVGPLDGGLAVLVHGAAVVDVLTGGETFRLDGNEAVTWVDRRFPIAVDRLCAALGRVAPTGRPDRWSRLDSGIVRAGGMMLGPAGAARGEASAGVAAGSADMSDLVQLADAAVAAVAGRVAAAGRAGGSRISAAAAGLSAVGLSGPSIADPDAYADGYDTDESVHAQPAKVASAEPSLASVENAPDRRGPEPRAAEPRAAEPRTPEPRGAGHDATEGDGPQPAAAEADAAADSRETGGAYDEASRRPSRLTLLRRRDPEPEPEPEPPLTPDTVVGCYCDGGHFNPPAARHCTSCGMRMPQPPRGTGTGQRPPLGVLSVDGGPQLVVDGTFVIGRDPEMDQDVAAGRAQPLRITDLDGRIASVHARVELDGWDVRVIDLGTPGGTHVCPPGGTEWSRVMPNVPTAIAIGSKVLFGRTGVRFEAYRSA